MLAQMAAVLLASEPDAIAAHERHQQQLFDRLAPTVVYISADRAMGSGVVVAPGLVLTNAHVVGKGSTVDVVLHDGRKTQGAVIERGSDEADLALVRVPLLDVPTAALSVESRLKVGSWVAAIGHGRGSVWSFNTGMVSNLYDGRAAREVFQTQIPLNPGNSGGPIVNRHGQVVGIVTSGIESANAINFGIDVNVAFRSLKGLRETPLALTIRAPAGVPVFIDGRNVGVGPLLVVERPAKRVEAFAVVNGAMVKKTVNFGEGEVSFAIDGP